MDPDWCVVSRAVGHLRRVRRAWARCPVAPAVRRSDPRRRGGNRSRRRKYLADFRTAAEYQMTHALGMIAVGILAMRRKCRALNVAGWSFFVGTILFSGSLYVLVLSGVRALGAITPFGGVLFIRRLGGAGGFRGDVFDGRRSRLMGSFGDLAGQRILVTGSPAGSDGPSRSSWPPREPISSCTAAEQPGRSRKWPMRSGGSGEA